MHHKCTASDGRLTQVTGTVILDTAEHLKDPEKIIKLKIIAEASKNYSSMV